MCAGGNVVLKNTHYVNVSFMYIDVCMSGYHGYHATPEKDGGLALLTRQPLTMQYFSNLVLAYDF